ncbi:SDR family oxidoreductase [Paraburkholderia sp. WC7.3d]|uniref:SDR family oxidoreductase n=1 Tax=Paraburkholderia sp. WC7.3d TaxID=2991069 RepID=UPI003D23069C
MLAKAQRCSSPDDASRNWTQRWWRSGTAPVRSVAISLRRSTFKALSIPVSAAHQKIDILFANAGGGEFAPLGSITEAQFEKCVGINMKGTLFTVQAALPLMPPGSAIVITGSIAAIQGTPAFGVYAATKAALRSFARTWASDLKGRDIRVNVVAPGVVVTPAYKSELRLTDEQIDAYSKEVAETTPLGRVGTADEIAKAVSFLASDDASYITGIELFVDGGRAQV